MFEYQGDILMAHKPDVMFEENGTPTFIQQLIVQRWFPPKSTR